MKYELPKNDAHMIVPFQDWMQLVMRLHEIAKERPPTHFKFWWDCYRNNESPLQACRHNYEYAPSAFWDFTIPQYEEMSKWAGVAPYRGIGYHTQFDATW